MSKSELVEKSIFIQALFLFILFILLRLDPEYFLVIYLGIFYGLIAVLLLMVKGLAFFINFIFPLDWKYVGAAFVATPIIFLTFSLFFLSGLLNGSINRKKLNIVLITHIIGGVAGVSYVIFTNKYSSQFTSWWGKVILITIVVLMTYFFWYIFFQALNQNLKKKNA
jgi:hypothetical protein